MISLALALMLTWSYPTSASFNVYELVSTPPKPIWVYTPKEKILTMQIFPITNRFKLIGTTTNHFFPISKSKDLNLHLFTVTATNLLGESNLATK